MTTGEKKHVGINAQLLSTSQSYRSAGVSGYVRQLLACLPGVAPDLRFTAFVPEQTDAAANGRSWPHDDRDKVSGAVDQAPAGSAAASPLAPIDNPLTLQESRHWNTARPWQRILWEQLALPRASRRAGLDLLHATVNVGPLAGACPTVVTVHDLSFLRYPGAFPASKRTYLRLLTGHSVQQASRVIAVSSATKRDVVSLLRVPEERVDVVPNGVDASFCPAPSPAIEAFRHHKDLPPRFLLHVGTLEPRKNLVRLVQAFARVLANETAAAREVALVLVGGKGWDYELIFREVTRLGLEHAVRFPGYVPDEELAWWYRAAAVFTYPSLMEGFGLPVLEAMACGTPVVTSNRSSLPEVAGDAAILVDPYAVDQLAAGLQAALTDRELAQTLHERGLMQAARFTWQQTALQTAAVYRRALAQRGSDR